MEKQETIFWGITFEQMTGVVIAFFAAILAITELGSGHYRDDELFAHAKHSEMYNWYNSKSIKQTLIKGQIDLLNSLREAEAINPASQESLNKHLKKLDSKVAKYELEMNEIRIGSKGVGKENWTQEYQGELGKLKGADEWEVHAEKLGAVGDTFDIAVLFIELGLVFGAVSLVLKDPKSKNIFVLVMCGISLVGMCFSIVAFIQALHI